MEITKINYLQPYLVLQKGRVDVKKDFELVEILLNIVGLNYLHLRAIFVNQVGKSLANCIQIEVRRIVNYFMNIIMVNMFV